MTNNRGFTLIEISIVLIIIGLLAGGILKGQSMIENARYTDFKKSVQSFSAATMAFYDRYKYLPGDFPKASSTFTAPAGVTIYNGNGDGRIPMETTWLVNGNAIVSTEQVAVIQHLALAGLIRGKPDLASAEDLRVGHSEGGFFAGVAHAGGLWLCVRGLTKKTLQRYDEEIDDGVIGTGKVVGWSHSTFGGDPDLYNVRIAL